MSLRECINVLILKHWTADTELGSRSSSASNAISLLASLRF